MQTAVAPQINSYTFKIKHLTVFTQRWEENVYCNFTLFLLLWIKTKTLKSVMEMCSLDILKYMEKVLGKKKKIKFKFKNGPFSP